jgi:hypothetical protein
MESFENDESDDDLHDSSISQNSDKSDFNFDSDELADDLDELEILSEQSTENEMDVDSVSQSHLGQGGFTSISSNDVTPILVFRKFFTEEIFNLIVDQTNIYGKQKKRRNSRNNTDPWEDVITKDIESFLGIIIVMGINSLPTMKHYWSKDNVFHNSFISSIMSRNRFLQIFYNLHLADNSLEPKSGSTNYSKIYKIKHFVEILLRNFQNNYKFGHYGSIDETMVKFKGRSSLKQYIPSKPIKRGYKIWCLCDSITGYLFNCRIYLGKEGTSDNELLLGERVVCTLIADHHFEGKHLYFDNFFTSLSLLEKLRRQRISATGTIRPDRVGIPSQFALKEKMERGDYKSIIISNIIIFKWMDTKHVFLASNECENTEIITTSRQLKNKQRIEVDCPKVIVDYNKFIHGVDKFNQRISSYTFDRKSRRNWLRLFFFFFNASLANSYICYNQLHQNESPYLDYLVSVAKSLCSGAKRKNIGRPTSTKKYEFSAPTSQFTDQLNSGMHLPVKGTRRRCANCSTNEVQVRSTIECSNCELAFCVTDEKNCFYEYHQRFM